MTDLLALCEHGFANLAGIFALDLSHPSQTLTAHRFGRSGDLWKFTLPSS
jgi:hypothetical protein